MRVPPESPARYHRSCWFAAHLAYPRERLLTTTFAGHRQEKDVNQAHLPTIPGESIVDPMSRFSTRPLASSSCGTGVVILVLFVCICVVSQMLGTPVTLIDVLTSELPGESVSEDFSIPPLTPEPSLAAQARLSEHVDSMQYLPILAISVFHPPDVSMPF